MKQNQEKIYSFPHFRLAIIAAVILVFGVIIIIKLFYLSVLEHPFYAALSSEKHEIYKNLYPNRGTIYAQEKGKLYPLVTDREYYLIYAEPTKVVSAKEVVDGLTPILGLEETEWRGLLEKLSKKNDPYVPIKRKVAKKQLEQIEAQNLEGIGSTEETYRFYPEQNIGGHIFGFVTNAENKLTGQYGLEGYYQR